MNDKLQTQPDPAEFLLNQTEGGQTRMKVAFRGETCRLSLKQLAELFQRDKSVISRHIGNIFVANFVTKVSREAAKNAKKGDKR